MLDTPIARLTSTAMHWIKSEFKEIPESESKLDPSVMKDPPESPIRMKHTVNL